MLTRRTLLGASLGTLPALHAWSAPGGAPDERVLVLLQLRGGNDGLNTVVPFEDPLYAAGRPNLRLAARDLHRLDELNGLHPSLARLARRHGEGQLAIVQGVGDPDSNLSHFRSMDAWDVGSTVRPAPGDGWLGRWCERALGADAPATAMIALGRDVLPRSLSAPRALACAVPSAQGYRIQYAPGPKDADLSALRRRALEALNPDVADGRLAPLAAAARAARASIEDVARADALPTRTRYPNSPLASQLRLAARLVAAGLPTRVVHVAQDGYDTHTSQADSHARLLATLDAALDAFLTDLAVRGLSERVLVMTISDFGRRVAENGVRKTAGTDHGAGSVMFFAGGGVRGGLHGAQPDLEHLDEHGNLVPLIDFRRAYATVIERWLGGKAEPVLGAAFPCLPVLE